MNVLIFLFFMQATFATTLGVAFAAACAPVMTMFCSADAGAIVAVPIWLALI
jgi:hypothetical protein